MRTKVLIYIVFSLFLSLPLDVAAQYRKDYKTKANLDYIMGEIKDYPKSGTLKDLKDEDYFSISYGIRFIAHISDDQQRTFGISDELRKKCRERDSLAWAHDIECNANTMLQLFQKDLKIGLDTINPTKVGILCKFIEDVFVVNKLMKRKYTRWRPWYHFWGKFNDKDELINEKEVQDRIRRDYEPSRRDEYCLKKVNNSYPSGHSVVAYASAIMMANLFYTDAKMEKEQFADSLMRTAYEFAMSRVVLGVHHYSDIQASYRQALAIIKLVKESSAFKKDLIKAGVTSCSTEIYMPTWKRDSLFLEVAKLNKLQFYCLEHGRTNEMTLESDETTTRFYKEDYHCKGLEDCRIHSSWKY